MALGCRSQLAAGLTGKKKAISISPRGVLRMIDAVGGVARAFLEQALMTDLRVALGDTPTGPGNKYRSKILSKTINHFERNRLRMRYQRLRRLDLDIATGVVEGAVRHLVGIRFDGPACDGATGVSGCCTTLHPHQRAVGPVSRPPRRRQRPPAATQAAASRALRCQTQGGRMTASARIHAASGDLHPPPTARSVTDRRGRPSRHRRRPPPDRAPHRRRRRRWRAWLGLPTPRRSRRARRSRPPHRRRKTRHSARACP